jgi:hypothetical protein
MIDRNTIEKAKRLVADMEKAYAYVCICNKSLDVLEEYANEPGAYARVCVGSSHGHYTLDIDDEMLEPLTELVKARLSRETDRLNEAANGLGFGNT